MQPLSVIEVLITSVRGEIQALKSGDVASFFFFFFLAIVVFGSDSKNLENKFQGGTYLLSCVIHSITCLPLLSSCIYKMQFF